MTDGSASRRLRRLLGAVVVTVAVVAPPASSAPDDATAAPLRALLVVGRSSTAIVSLAGQRLPVPARVQESPRGLSPDARLVARSGPRAVLLGPVQGGSMRVVLRGSCITTCPYGADPSFAWRPDSRQLAAAVNPAHGATQLGLFGRDGRRLRSLTLPAVNAEQGGRAFHRLHSWSPDAPRLLLVRGNEFGPTALVALDLRTGKLRRLTKISGPGASPSAAWSPDGGLVAFSSSGTHDALDQFSVIEAATARPIIQCPKDVKGPPTECPGGTVWAADGRSVFGPGVYRYFLDGRHVREVRSPAGLLTPQVATPTGLLYTGRGGVYLHSLSNRSGQLLFRSSDYIDAVLPLEHLP